MNEFEFLKKKLKKYTILNNFFFILTLLAVILTFVFIKYTFGVLFVFLFLLFIIFYFVFNSKYKFYYRKFTKINDMRIAINSLSINKDN